LWCVAVLWLGVLVELIGWELSKVLLLNHTG